MALVFLAKPGSPACQKPLLLLCVLLHLSRGISWKVGGHPLATYQKPYLVTIIDFFPPCVLLPCQEVNLESITHP